MKNQLLVLLRSPCIVTDGFLIVVFKVFSWSFLKKNYIFCNVIRDEILYIVSKGG